MTRVCDYADVPLVLVMAKDRNIDGIETLATVPFLMDNVGTAIQIDDTKVVTFDTQQECIDALKENAVDAVFCDGYLAEYLIRTKFQYDNLQIKNVLSGEHAISMAIREKDRILLSILEKTISTIDSKKINIYMLKENTYPLVNIINFVKKYSLWIISGLILCIILVIAVAFQMIMNGKKIQKLMYRDSKIDICNGKFESVCKMIRRRLDAGLPVVTVSCNFSRTHFIKPGFPEHFIEILNRYQIPKDLIEVEITETLIEEEFEQKLAQ